MSRNRRTILYVTTGFVWAAYVTVQIVDAFTGDEPVSMIAAGVLRAVASVLAIGSILVALLHPLMTNVAAFYLAGAAAAAKPKCDCQRQRQDV